MAEKLGLEFYVRRSVDQALLDISVEFGGFSTPGGLITHIINKMDEEASRVTLGAGIVASLDDIRTSVHSRYHSTEIVRYYQCSPKGTEDAR